VQHANPNSFRSGPDDTGHFGIFGGRFVAETLMPLILDLEKAYNSAKADPAFKAELLANPAAALKAEGIDVPAGMAVTVVENTDKQFHLVLPPVPSDELSDEALDAVSGGGAGPTWGCALSPCIVS
jgi:hypothetical protein